MPCLLGAGFAYLGSRSVDPDGGHQRARDVVASRRDQALDQLDLPLTDELISIKQVLLCSPAALLHVGPRASLVQGGSAWAAKLLSIAAVEEETGLPAVG